MHKTTVRIGIVFFILMLSLVAVLPGFAIQVSGTPTSTASQMLCNVAVDDGVLTYQYAQEPTGPLTLYFSFKNDAGVLVDFKPYTPGAIQQMKDASGETITYSVPLPTTESGASSGTVYFWNGDSLAPLHTPLPFTAPEEASTKTFTQISGTQYAKYNVATGVVEYTADEASSVTETVTIQEDVTIFYNGSPVENSSKDVLADYLDAIKDAGCGDVALLDTDATAGCDVVNISIPTFGVVREVTDSGILRFFKQMKESVTGNTIALAFDEESPDVVIHLTKNGKAIHHSELKPWDILAIYWDGVTENYDIRVLPESMYVDGIISMVYSGGIQLSNGKRYTIANHAYKIDMGMVQPGMNGRFYLDFFGRIIAYDPSVEVVPVNYAYILDAAVVASDWGADSEKIYVKMLANDGEIYEAPLASVVKFTNLNYHASLGDLLGEDVWIARNTVIDFTREDHISPANFEEFAKALVNTVIAYESNGTGELTSVTLWQGEDDTRPVEVTSITTENSYNKDGKFFNKGNIFLNDDTKVFYIAGDGILYDDASVIADESCSGVGTVEGLVDGATYDAVAIGRNRFDEAKVLVLLNTESPVLPTVSETEEQYGYVLNTALVASVWRTDPEDINVKILSENGEIYEAELASQIKLVNLDLDCNAHIADLFTAAVVLDETTVVNLTKETHIARSNLDKFAGTLINTAISYRCNNKGEISTIILGQNESSTRPMELLETISDGENTYDAESGFFSKGSTPISENAKVFYISGEDTISYAGYVIAKDGRCSAGDVNSLQDEGNYEAVLLFSRDVNDKAEVVLLLNEETPVTDDTTDEAEAQYAYVLAAEPVAGSWSTDREFINVKILSENGEIYEAELASKMKLVNLDLDCNAHIGDLFGSAVVLDETTTVDFTEESHIASANLYDFADALVNTMISYRGNSEGQISTIIFGQDEDDTRPMEILASSTSAEYNKADLVFDGMRNARVNEDTVVFYITSYEDYISYGDSSSMADSDKCLVGTIETLVDGGRYDIIAIGRDENDEAEVVLLLNEEIGGKYDQSASIAVVDRVGATVVNGTDFVYTVTFYMDGELKTATTKVDMDGAGYDFEYAQQGDIVKLNLYKDTILAAEPVLTFDRQGYGFYAPAFGDGVSAMAPVFSLNSFLGEDEEFYFGAVTDFRVNGVAQVALLNENGIATGEIKSIKEAEDTCSYEYNPNKKAEECLSVGSLLDANADADLLDEGRYVYLKREPEQVFVETGLDNAIGMMDYVFVRYYNKIPADIVVYKNYHFGVYIIEDAFITGDPT